VSLPESKRRGLRQWSSAKPISVLGGPAVGVVRGEED